jgi:hypothetical protein|tara:strand:+ start:8 stop:838 length:831 start_codon:yes stop_codon:yes gene_type:complete
MTETVKKQVAKSETKAVAQLSAVLKSAPLSKREAEDYSIPYLNMLSKGSPQVDEENDKFIKEAKKGQIFNTVTETCSDVLTVLPVYYRRRYVEWYNDRTKNKAPVNEYLPEEFQTFQKEGKIVRGDDKKDRFVGKGDTYVENTAEHYVIVIDGQSWYKALIKMKGSQLKKSRQWNSIMSNQRRVDGDEIYQPKDFAMSYNLSGKPEKNDQGSWHGWAINQNKWIDELGLVKVEDILADASQFEKTIHSGELKVAPQEDETSSPQGESSQNGDNIPF